MTTIEVIDALLAVRGISAARMMRELGFSSGLYSQWRKGNQTPSTEKITAISNYFDIPADILIDPSNCYIDDDGIIKRDTTNSSKHDDIDNGMDQLITAIEALRIKKESEESQRIIKSIVSVLVQMSEENLKKTEQIVNVMNSDVSNP